MSCPGRPRVLPDGRVGKFGWKAQFATLEEFVAAACANEIGLGNPRMEQARPMVSVAYPSVDRDLTDAQFRTLVAFVDTLPRPIEATPDDPDHRLPVRPREGVFRQIGCAVCHTPDVGGVEGVYSDFLLHRLDDREGSPRRICREAAGAAAGRLSASRGVEDAPALGRGRFRPVFPRRRGPDPRGRHPSTPRRRRIRDGGLPRPPGRRPERALVDFLKTLRAPSDVPPAPATPSRRASSR